MAIHSMTRLNRMAAKLYLKHDGHASTDITGFGILGHASNLARYQENPVAFHIHTLPIIPKMAKVNECVDFRLFQGLSSETSGGLFIAFPREKAEAFCKEIEELEGCPAWIVGDVVKWNEGDPRASISTQVKILEAPYRTFRKKCL
jgi:selenide, water dikinase